MKDPQCTDTILMIRPAHFGFNPETAENNVFQSNTSDLTTDQIQEKAQQEFDTLAKTLETKGIKVIIVEDTDSPIKPDAIFPNNWISIHSNGAIITYPMQSGLRRKERREDVIDMLMERFSMDRRYSLEHYETKNLYLEGTGSMVLDRINKVVYACISVRTDPTILDKFCALTGYQRIVFEARDLHGNAIYHTNVMMCLGENFVVICLESIQNPDECSYVKQTLLHSGREIIEISQEQLAAFAGNMLELSSIDGLRKIVLSQQAYHSLTTLQREILSGYGEMVYTPLDTIEHFGGGSARCMIAEIFTPNRSASF